MKIRKLILKNLHSLRLEAEIDFLSAPLGNTGLFAITGDTGAGKSTILDAITLALYGALPRESAYEEIISYGASASLAELEFEHNGRLLRAKWSVHRAGGKVDGKIQAPRRELAQWDEAKQAFIPIAEKAKEVDQQVERLTGLDYERFRRSVLLAQGDFAAFLHAKEGERSELLEKITGSEIYSELSKAAFARHKAEDAKLKELQAEVNRLELLPPDQLADLAAQIVQSEKEGAELQRQQTQLREWRQILDRKSELEQTLDNLSTEYQSWQQARDAAQPGFLRLQRFQTLRPYQPDLQKQQALQQELQRGQTNLQQVQQELQQLDLVLNRCADQVRSTQQELERAQVTQKEQEPILAQALQLDIERATRMPSLDQQRLARQQVQDEKIQLEAQAAALQTAAQQMQERWQKVKTWLAEHPNWTNLPEWLPWLQSELSALEEARQQQQLWQKEITLKQSQWQNLAEKLTNTSAAQHKLQEELQQLQTAYQQILPPEIPQDEAELLGWLVQDIQRLNQRRNQLEQLLELNHNYRQSLEEVNLLETQLETLRSRELDLQKQLLNLIDEQELSETTLHYKQHIYEQQRLIANYEQDRNALQEGEPCPLCFSTEHPFRHHQVTAFVDRARAEYETALKDVELLRQTRQELVHQLRSTNTEVDRLEQPLHGQLGLALQRINELELKRGTVLGELGGLESNPQQADVLPNLLQTTVQQLNQRQQAIAQLEELSKTIQQKQQALLNHRQEEQELRAAQGIQQARLQDLEEQLLQIQTRIALKQRGIEEKLEVLSITYVEDTPALLQELLQSREHWQKAQELNTQLERELEQNSLAQQHNSTAIQRLDRQLQQLGAQLEQEEQALETLRSKRVALFGDEPIEPARARLAEAVDQAHLALQAAQEAWNLARENQVASLTRQENLQTAQQETSRSLEALEVSLLTLAQQHGLIGIAALHTAMLNAEEESQLRAEQEQLARREAELLRLRQETQFLLSDLLLKVSAIPEPTTLDQQLTTLDQAWQQLQQNLGQLQEKRSRHEQQAQRAQALWQSIAAQQKEYQRWAVLNDLIGSADGKKFRTFAQGLTLSKLIYLANQHMQQLNGRYVILKRPQEDLGLEIMDTFQANNRRGMRTLSGGESFLVSLALALALSELAGRNTAIQSLFIDEGFGTLDDSSLDLAINTLENLQSSGKTIGIISHVKELKERISVQIQVKKQSDGFSQIRILQ